MLPVCLFSFFFCLAGPVGAQVVINEYSASNLRDYNDLYGKTEDWIELYNTSSETQDIGGWWLSDKENKPMKWKIPPGTTLPADTRIVFWCSGRDTFDGVRHHTNFKLTQTKGNEFVVLTRPDSTTVQSLPLELTLLGHSRCLETDGGNAWRICTEPTFNAPNTGAPMFTAYTQTPQMSLEAGFYTDVQMLTISTTEDNVEIRYTTDGTTPVADSPLYTDTLTIDETMVVKARAFPLDSTRLPGKVVFNTYFINEDFSLAVFSVAADEVIDLANGDGSLRPIGSLEYFNLNKERTATAYGELNRHGQDSWVNPHRSIDWVTRDEMGYTNAVFEKLFGYSDRDKFQRLMFRASGDDNYPATDADVHEGSTHIRDEYVHNLALLGGMKLDVRAVERVIVFLNGKYWGVYGLRERPVDHDYTKEYYDQDKYHLYYLSTWGSTWAEYGGAKAFEDWEKIRDFILQNDMADSTNYAYVKSKIRLTSLIDYFIANLNSVASDWLNYNTGWWRGTDPDGDHKKWGYILWDNDATFDYYINYSGVPNTGPDAQPCDIDQISIFMDDFFGNDDVGKHEKIFLKLQQQNDEFRQLYYSRQADLMNTVYTCENMLHLLDSMVAVIEPEMPRQIARWGGSMAEWQQNVANLRSFIEARCTLLDDGMVDCFNLTGPYNLTLKTEPEGIGKIKLNTLKLSSFPWSGDYFGNMENLLSAKTTDDNLPFLEWRSAAGHSLFPDSASANVRIILTANDTLTAVFGTPSPTVEAGNALSFSVYPTLAREVLTLEYELDRPLSVEVGLFNILGEKVKAFPEAGGWHTSGNYHYRLPLSGVAAGTFFLTVSADGAQATTKIIITDR